MSFVADHYDDHSDHEWQRLQRHRTEFAVTLRALDAYLPPSPAAILDIGGGPGRYAIELTRRGYEVTLLDLSQGNLSFAEEKAAEQSIRLAHVVQGDATELPSLPIAEYDAVLLMGPLYHLLSLADRRQAVDEARKVLRPNGAIFAAFVTRFAVIRDLVINNPQWIIDNPLRLEQTLQTGVHPTGPDKRHPDFYFAHPDEIRPLMESAGFETKNLIGCEGVAAGHEETINQVEGELWQKWVALNYQLGQEPTLHSAADHLLYIGRKKP